MRTATLVLALCFPLVGCAGADVVTERGGGEFAPANDKKGGTVRYLNQGMTSVRRARREAAYRQMHESCGGPYILTSEVERADSAVGIPIGGVMVSEPTRYVHLDFECKP